jgi:hypothetical protein
LAGRRRLFASESILGCLQLDAIDRSAMVPLSDRSTGAQATNVFAVN